MHKRWSMACWIVVLAVTLGLLGCGDDDSDDSAEESLEGTWVGIIRDSQAGRGEVRATIAQDGAALRGTWQSTFADASLNNSGSLTGTVDGTAIEMILRPSNPRACPFDVTATLTGADRITGTYAAFDCTGAVTGSLTVSRQ